MIAPTTKINITTAGGTFTCSPSNVHEYTASGSGTLTSSVTIAASSPTAGIPTKVVVNYKGTFVLGGNTITILGTALTAEQASGGATTITRYYNGTAWESVQIVDSTTIQSKSNEGVNSVTLNSGGGTINLNPATDKQTQYLTGSATLAASYVFQGGGSPQNGDTFTIIYDATMTADGNNITIFGISLTDLQILKGGITITATYDGSAWVTSFSQNPNNITGIYETIPVLVSFETDEKGQTYLPLKYPCVIQEVHIAVAKDIEVTDFGYVQLSVNGTDVFSTPRACSGSMGTFDTVPDVIPIATNETDGITIQTTKATDGGRILLQITVQRT